MNGYRRSIPRSVRRTPAVKQESTPKLGAGLFDKEEISPARYVPEFSRRGRQSFNDNVLSVPSQETPTKIEPTEIEKSNSVVEFSGLPLTSIRWLPGGGRSAIAAVGTGHGEGEDYISFYSVSKDMGLLRTRLAHELNHKGKVMKLAVSERDEMVYSASSDGGIRGVRVNDIEEEDLNFELMDIAHTSKVCQSSERMTSIAAIHRTAIATGDEGSILVVDIESGSTDVISQADDAGFRDVACADESGKEILTAGGCKVSVWDIRARTDLELQYDTGDIPLCVAVDPGQPHFVMAGFRNGGILLWDQRGTDKNPMNEAVIHNGPVWDLGVVSGNKAGLLLSCGEDANVWLLDFASAASRLSVENVAQPWYNQGEFWRATLSGNDVSNMTRVPGHLGINSVHAHTSADLFAYTTDSGSIAFSCLFS